MEIENSSWTLKERQLVDFRNTNCDKETQQLSDVIRHRMRESTLGMFLHHLNKGQEKSLTIQLDKLDRVIFDVDKQLVNLKILLRRNDLCEKNLFTLIQELLGDNPSGIITAKKVLQELTVLRLTGSKVTTMDDSLQILCKLQALVLTGNCLSSVPGRYLPRQLLLLELCCNRLQDLSHLLEDCPSHLLYLGLSRNYLTRVDSRLAHLAQNLYHLDLAHNDIEELTSVVSACSELYNLSSLLLIDNPCSMTENYLYYITCKLPKLIFLDGIKIKKTCEDFKILNGDNFTGTLQITLFRILSLPQPPPEKINKKKILHSFRIEISCPLLKSYIPVRDEFYVEDVQSGRGNTEEQIKEKVKESSKSRKKGRNKNEDISKAVAEDSKEIKEYEAILKTDYYEPNSILVSDRKPWGKIVEFVDPTVKVDNCNLLALRNVFRSNLTIRLVHFKTISPDVKKRKTSKKTKKQNNKNKSSEENNEHIETKPKETLVSKTTLAKLELPLQEISWNMNSLDFSWSKASPLKAETALGLKELQYITKKKKKEAKSQKRIAKENTTELQAPSQLTIHIGVGVKRLQINNEKK